MLCLSGKGLLYDGIGVGEDHCLGDAVAVLQQRLSSRKLEYPQRELTYSRLFSYSGSSAMAAIAQFVLYVARHATRPSRCKLESLRREVSACVV